MTDAEVTRVLARMAGEIATANRSPAVVVLAGIQTGGVQLARRLARELQAAAGLTVELGELDISMHRDDLDSQPAPNMHPTAMPLNLSGKNVVLVDDVLFSGRTARAALDALNDLGRPCRIQLAVLVDRGHRELPIKADFVGAALATAPADKVDVQVDEADGKIKVVLEKAAVQ